MITSVTRHYTTCTFGRIQSDSKDQKLSDDAQVAIMLMELDLQAPGNVSCVDENTRGHTAVVSVGSALASISVAVATVVRAWRVQMKGGSWR
ncbi:hypothetical protein JG687_00006677 [Phytophthora cactorum]|uniref:Uncharacterized protein n=1 Tax=Phytophthora cactorum TaxID=29920 RepID=A0A8T1UIX8_9STRA|nr:hypothetical protein JG687_00006677 [Phytophthora cactorum]